MIKIIFGGKPSKNWNKEALDEYLKRLKKPFDVEIITMDDDKLAKYLEKWPFKSDEYIILADERGKILSSPELSQKLESTFNSASTPVIIIGGAYGFTDAVRQKANFIWSFSHLVFPHLIARLIVIEQVYRAQEIAHNSQYHHE